MNEIVESARPLPESSLWPYMRAFYQSVGPASWGEGIVPFRSTTSPQLANAYVRAIASYFSDLDRAGRLDRTQPVDIVELGIGSGATALYFLLEWFNDGFAAHAQPIRYIATDLAQRNLDALRAHPSLTPFFEKGVLQTALFDAENPATLTIGDSVVFSGKKTSATTIVLANYVFDSLPTRAFSWDKQALQEWHVALEREPGKGPFSHEDPLIAKFRGVVPVFTRVPVEQPSFDHPMLDRVFKQQLEVESATFLFPFAGLRCLDWLVGHTAQLLLLVTDKGSHFPAAYDADKPPFVQDHGSYSVDVNFYAFTRYALDAGGLFWVSPRRHYPLTYMAQAYGTPKEVFTSFLWTLKDSLERYSIGDAQQLAQAEVEALVERDPYLPYTAVLAKLRHSSFDTFTYLNVIPLLNTTNLKLKPTPVLQKELRESLQEVLRRSHPAASLKVDVACSVASHLAQIGAYQEALGAYAQSLGKRGLDAWRALFGSAFCLLKLDQVAAARETYGVLQCVPVPEHDRPEFEALEKTLLNIAKEMNVSMSG